MMTGTRTAKCVGVLVLLCAGLVAPGAWAGIPEPGLLLYGKVYDENDQLLTSGQVRWTFDPSVGSDPPYTVTVDLEPLAGSNNETFSYAVQIPFETATQGYPVSPATALELKSTPVNYTRTAEVLGHSITMTRSVNISALNRGAVERVDICASGNCTPNSDYHSADSDQNLTFSLTEFLRVVQLFTETVTHDYHCDPGNGEDGFAPGTGDQTCTPHSSDYLNGSGQTGANWRISLSEMVRMIELYASTPEHGYCTEPDSEDGWTPGACGKAFDYRKSAESAKYTELELKRTIVADPGVPGALLVTIKMGMIGVRPITGLGIEDTLPEGWVFDSVVAGANPLIAPEQGATGLLEFAWLPLDAYPATVTYRVFAMPETLDAVPTGQGLYRFLFGPGERVAPIKLKQVNKQDDRNGDGIPDTQQEGDTDGNGVPDKLQTDASKALPVSAALVTTALALAAMLLLRRNRSKRGMSR